MRPMLIAILLISFLLTTKLSRNVFSSDTWETRTADDVNLNNKQIDKLFRLTLKPCNMSAVLIKDGLL